jgi:hypothetical protein
MVLLYYNLIAASRPRPDLRAAAGLFIKPRGQLDGSLHRFLGPSTAVNFFSRICSQWVLRYTMQAVNVSTVITRTRLALRFIIGLRPIRVAKCIIL